MSEIYLTRKQAAAFLTRIGCPVTYRQLSWWAENDNRRGGPPYTRVRTRLVHYSETDLKAWAKQNTKRIE